MDRSIALTALVIILLLVNWSIYQKEEHLANGNTAYLELAPVDPRSLMQGDYMALRFQLSRKVSNALPKNEKSRSWRHNIDASDGYVIVKLDEKNIASYKALYTDQTLADNEILMRYRVRNGTVKFATNAFFFQEGHAKHYEPARYGQFRVDSSGELLLVAMYDKELNRLSPVDNNPGN
jgi:uncharacterized membrane-anchored protein